MGRERPRLSPAVRDAYETLLWVCKAYYAHTGELHTFSPRKFLGVIKGEQKWEVPELEDLEAIEDTELRGLMDLKILKIRASDVMVALNKYLNEKRAEREAKGPYYPSSPTHPPILNVYAKNLEDSRSSNSGFAALYAARRYVDFIIQDRPYRWIDDNTIIVNDRVQVWTDAKPDGLSEILEHEFTLAERRWELPREYMRRAVTLFVPREPDWLDNWQEEKKQERIAAKETKRERKAKVKEALKDSAAASAPTKAPRPEGLVTLPTLLADTDIDPKEARNALRKTNTPKPEHGRWEWSPADAPAIKATIVAAVAKMRKK